MAASLKITVIQFSSVKLSAKHI